MIDIVALLIVFISGVLVGYFTKREEYFKNLAELERQYAKEIIAAREE